MATPDELHPILAVLSAAFPTFSLTDATMQVYERMLADLDAHLLEAAALQHVADNRYFPTISELRALCREIGNPGALAPSEAWGIVIREIQNVGSYGTPNFGDPLITTAVEQIGGWKHLCLSENVIADRARFIDAFRDLRSTVTRELALLPAVKALAEKMRTPALRLEAGEPLSPFCPACGGSRSVRLVPHKGGWPEGAPGVCSDPFHGTGLFFAGGQHGQDA